MIEFIGLFTAIIFLTAGIFFERQKYDRICSITFGITIFVILMIGWASDLGVLAYDEAYPMMLVAIGVMLAMIVAMTIILLVKPTKK